MSKRLLEKAGLIGLPSGGRDPVLNRSTPPIDANRPKTAPGTMLGFMSAQSAAVQEVEALREKVKEFEGASTVRPLDPNKIAPSKWANRHDANFHSQEFSDLKNEIQQAGGNVQAIKVRPIQGLLNGSTSKFEYEVVFGHRRHRACLELGLPVNAMIESLTDLQLFEQMERENRNRKNLSPWEQGNMYRQALDDGLFPSQRKLSEALGVDVSMVSKSIALARLPVRVVEAFPSPLDIQYRWAQPLADAVQKDPDGTIAKAAVLKATTPRPNASSVFASLTQEPLNGSTPRAPITVGVAGKKLALIESDAKGRTFVRFEAGVLPDSKRMALAKLIEDFLAK